MARPTKYDDKFSSIAKKVCELGGTDVDIIEVLGIARSTYYKWKTEHKSFSDAIKVGKGPADERVKMALYQRAIGYSHPEDDIRVVDNQLVITPTTKHYPPDSTALIYWTKNRMPDEFRQNQGDSKFKFKFMHGATPIQNAEHIFNSAAAGDLPTSTALNYISAIKSVIEIEKETDLKNRLEEIEKSLGIAGE